MLFFWIAVDLTDIIPSRKDLRIITEVSVAIVHQDLSWACIGLYGVIFTKHISCIGFVQFEIGLKI